MFCFSCLINGFFFVHSDHCLLGDRFFKRILAKQSTKYIRKKNKQFSLLGSPPAQVANASDAPTLYSLFFPVVSCMCFITKSRSAIDENRRSMWNLVSCAIIVMFCVVCSTHARLGACGIDGIAIRSSDANAATICRVSRAAQTVRGASSERQRRQQQQ